MGDDIPAVDQYGNRGTFRRSGGGDGCFGPLIVMGLVIAIPIALIVFLVVGVASCMSAVQNYATYHIFNSDTSQAMTGATATAEAPYHYEELAMNAVYHGAVFGFTFHSANPRPGHENSSIVHLGKDGTMTFDNVSVQSDGDYTLTVYINGFLGSAVHPYHVHVSVNGGRPGVMLSFATTWAPDSTDMLITTVRIKLKAGNNTIKFYNASGGDNNCSLENYDKNVEVCTGIESIVVDKVWT